MGDTAGKYDRLAEGFAENSYANLEFYMHQRFMVATYWGILLRPGDSVLELGCDDSYLAQFFVKHGLRYSGVDISPKMVAVAEQRLREHGLVADFAVADVSQILLSEPYNAVVSYMRAFYICS